MIAWYIIVESNDSETVEHRLKVGVLSGSNRGSSSSKPGLLLSLKSGVEDENKIGWPEIFMG